MRITSTSVFDSSSAQMRRLSAEAGRINTTIATGVRFTQPSEDVVAFRALAGIKRAGEDTAVAQANLKRAGSLLDSTDAALASVETQMQRAQEIAIAAGSGTVSPEQRAIYAAELDAMVQDLARLANGTDATGQPLFSGTSTDAPYTIAADGTVTYVGAGEASPIPIGEGASIAATVPGSKAFGFTGVGGETDIFATVKGLADSLRAGSVPSGTLGDVKAALDNLGTTRASVGARGARVEIETARLADVAVARETTRAGLEDTDPYEAYAALQKTLSILEATQASFGKLSQLSLFDYLR